MATVKALVPGRLRRVLIRAGIPEGTIPVALGLTVAALCAYGFLVFAGKALGPARYAHLSVLWSATFLLGTGLFLPLEQELGRALAVRRARSEPGGALVVRAARHALIGVAFLAAAVLAWRGPIVDRLFDGEASLLLALLLGLVSLAAAYVARGFLSGTARFGRYGALNAAEGLVRLVPAAVLALAAFASGFPYALAFALAPLFASAVTALGPYRETGPGPACRPGELDRRMGRLVAASLLAQALLNLPVLAVKLLATGPQAALAGRFMAGVVVARVPVLAFSAVQASLVPKLSSLHARSAHGEFRMALGKLVLTVGLAGAVATAAAWGVGAPLIRALFGEAFRLSAADLAYLAGASALYLLALALGQSLIARGAYSRLAAGWGAGLVAGLAALALEGPLLVRVERAFLIGAAASLVVIGAAALRQLREVEIEPDMGSVPVLEPV